MSEQSESLDGDFTYDEAHAFQVPDPKPPGGQHDPVVVPTVTPADGDYSYDLAHDVPPA